jgi:hypothetical protein
MAEINVDQKTLDLIAEVNKRKKEIAKANRPNYITNCAFNFIEGKFDGAINLHVETSIDKLIKIASYIIAKEKGYKEAAFMFGLEKYIGNFTYNGYKCEDWIHDIKARIDKIMINEKQKSLDKLEERLNAIISPELKRQMELEAIANELE